MPAQITNYKCPTCTGPLQFDGEVGKLECAHCGNQYEIDEITAIYEAEDRRAVAAAEAEKKQKAASAQWDYSNIERDWGEDGKGLREYTCPSCGAALVCDQTTAATSCPYCGNHAILEDKFSGALRPELIIPFKLDEKAAREALKKHYKGKRFLPLAFVREKHLNEIKGVYVPFWLFDGVAEANILFDATRSHVHTNGGEKVTTTEHFNVRRQGTVTFERVPVDASQKLPDDLMDSLEPFFYSELKPFSTAYLPGYLADVYDATPEESAKRADKRAENTAVTAMQESAAAFYDTCTIKQKQVRLQRGRVNYALLPVWLLNTKWRGKDYLFAVNGQTGKLVGELPMSWGRFWAWFAGIAVPVAAAVSALTYFLL